MVIEQLHTQDRICRCKNCVLIDCLIGDPLLNNWEKEFIESISRQGWYKDYSEKQVCKLEQIKRKLFRERGVL